MANELLNAEGYPDPTAYQAIKKSLQRKNKYRPLVYICSRYAGDVDKNVEAAIKYSRFAIEQDAIPMTVHLLYPQILDDSNPKERKLGLFFGEVLLDVCRDMWIFGDGEYSSGMQKEYEHALKKGYTIRYFTEALEEITDRTSHGRI